MLMTKANRPATRTLRGWAISVLQEAGAICECEEHGWMQDRADPHACERAVDMARRDPPPGIPPEAAVAEVREVLDSIGDTCPECPVFSFAVLAICVPSKSTTFQTRPLTPETGQCPLA